MEQKVFAYPSNQLFACRNCPSRCCKNWTVDISLSDVERFRGQSWVQERLRATGTEFISLGPDHFLLPVIESDRQLSCVFLETDGLCGLHKRFGHDFLATTCQTFPFDFVEGEAGEIITVTSQVCPSIRDNYGVPLNEIIEDKFQESGALAKKQSSFLILGTSAKLTLAQYSALFREWEKIISGEKCLPLALALCFRLNGELAAKWGDQPEIPEEEFSAGLEEALKKTMTLSSVLLEELVTESRGYHRVSQVLLAFACLPLSHPFRSRITYQGKRKPGYILGVLRSLLNLLLNRGKVDILYLGDSIPLTPALWSKKVLTAKEWPEVSAYLLNVLRRRRFSMDPKNTADILFLLAMAASSYGFFAKLHAINLGKDFPDTDDFREARSAIEMSVLHQKVFFEGGIYEAILNLLLRSPNTIPRLLTAEIPFAALNNYPGRLP